MQKLVSLAEINRQDIVLEVGAGSGNLTRILQKSAQQVIAIEKDPSLVRYLKRQFRDTKNIVIVHGDVLEIKLPDFDKVVSSPPYNISSKLLFTLLGKRFLLATMIFQKEFAERLVAKPGTREYGRLTVMLQHRARAELFDFVPRTAFRPIPRVDSFIVRITPQHLTTQGDERLFEEIVRVLFSQRRRIAETVLRHWLEKNGVSAARMIVKSLGIPPKRAFELTTKEIEEISQNLQNHKEIALGTQSCLG